MVTDQQVRKLMTLLQHGQSLTTAAAKTGMDEGTARKYRQLGQLPSEVRRPHDWRTRPDPFAEVWDAVQAKLEATPGLQAKTLFQDLQRQQPGRFQDGQLRTLQRRVKRWRAVAGPPKEVFFAQRYEPGALGQSDFTHLDRLGVRIQGQPFDHLLYHFVLPYSNWEWGTVCFTESFESLSAGLQTALWRLGGAPHAHRTDRLSAAVHQEIHPEVFTQRYRALLAHYRMEGRRIQAAQPHENGDVEQRHHRIKEALDQALLLRGSRDFVSRAAYETFLGQTFETLNAGRRTRLAAERAQLRPLPPRRLEAWKRVDVRVTGGSLIRVAGNRYSVDSRLIGEQVQVRVYADELQVWYAQRHVETLPRLRGAGKHRIAYRHIIDGLVRKPGAFEHYRYRDELFPTTQFRLTYDALRQALSPPRASAAYLQVLQLAAHGSEGAVDRALGRLLRAGTLPTVEAVADQLQPEGASPTEVEIAAVTLDAYDHLLEHPEAGAWS